MAAVQPNRDRRRPHRQAQGLTGLIIVVGGCKENIP